MKRLILIAAGVLFAMNSTFAWGILGHTTVAKIAENNLTPKAKRELAKYFGKQSIVFYATYPDYYRAEWLVDYGFDPTNGKRVNVYPHTFEVDKDFKPFRGFNDNGRYVKNCVHFIDEYAKELRNARKNMTDSTIMQRVIMLVHLVGDMHCPEHIQYNPEDMSIGKYKVRFDNRNVKYHTFWDEEVFTRRNPFSFSDTALLLDTWSDERIAATVAGEPYDWAEDSARRSYPVHAYKEGAELKRVPYLNEFTPLAEDQIRRAGYRLAKLLNDIFGR